MIMKHGLWLQSSFSYHDTKMYFSSDVLKYKAHLYVSSIIYNILPRPCVVYI